MDFKMCIPSQDEKHIFEGHMGDSPIFMIYKMENGKAELIEKRENPPFKENHGSGKKMKHVLQIVGDCDVFVGNVLSPNFLNLRSKTHVQPVVCKFSDLPQVLENLERHSQVISSLVKRRKNGEKPSEIPLISDEGLKFVK